MQVVLIYLVKISTTKRSLYNPKITNQKNQFNLKNRGNG
jgi:hypothetical protein